MLIDTLEFSDCNTAIFPQVMNGPVTTFNMPLSIGESVPYRCGGGDILVGATENSCDTMGNYVNVEPSCRTGE